MKKIFLLSILALSILSGCKTSQVSPEKEAKKIVKQVQNEAIFDKSVRAIKEQNFVIEADRVNFKGGRSIYVNSNTNFISLQDDKAVIQLSFNTPYAGPNGIGGITVEGKVSNIKMKTDKQGNVIYNMSVLGVGVSADVSFTLQKSSNKVTANVNPNFNSNRIMFTGTLLPTGESSVFKGKAL